MNARINAEKTLLPTAMTQGLKVSDRNGKTVFMPLDLLPTPMASDGQGGAQMLEGGTDGSVGLARMARLLPTPKAQELRGNASVDRGKFNLTDEIARIYSPGGGTSQLNPLYVGDMMGFPVDWVVSPFLGGGQSR